MSIETKPRPLPTTAPHDALTLSANDWDQGYVLPVGATTIGAGPKCDIRLDGPGLKPLHCVVTQADGGATVRRWSPGTKLNGKTFTEAALSAGDCLTVGEFQLVVSSGDSQSEDAAAPAATSLASEAEPRADEPDQQLLADADPEPIEPLANANPTAPEGWDWTLEDAAPAPESPTLEAPLEEAADTAPSPTAEPSVDDDTKPTSAALVSDSAPAEEPPKPISVPVVPPHLLRPWEAFREQSEGGALEAAPPTTDGPIAAPGPADEAGDSAALEEATEQVLPADEPTAPSDAFPPTAASEATSEETAEALCESASQPTSEPTEEPCETGVQHDVCCDPLGVEFYTDVDWQVVEEAQPADGATHTADAGVAIPEAQPIDLAAVVQHREQAKTARARTRKIIQTLRSERMATAAASQDSEGLAARCSELECRVTEVQSLLDEQESLNADLKAEKQSLEAALEAARANEARQAAENQELRAQLDQQVSQIAELSEAIQQWESEQATLRSELELVREQLEAALVSGPAEVSDPVVEPSEGDEPLAVSAEEDATGEEGVADTSEEPTPVEAPEPVSDIAAEGSATDWTSALADPIESDSVGREEPSQLWGDESSEQEASESSQSWSDSFASDETETDAPEAAEPPAPAAEEAAQGAYLWATPTEPPVEEATAHHDESAAADNAETPNTPEASDPWSAPLPPTSSPAFEEAQLAAEPAEPEAARVDEVVATSNPSDVWDIERTASDEPAPAAAEWDPPSAPVQPATEPEVDEAGDSWMAPTSEPSTEPVGQDDAGQVGEDTGFTPEEPTASELLGEVAAGEPQAEESSHAEPAAADPAAADPAAAELAATELSAEQATEYQPDGPVYDPEANKGPSPIPDWLMDDSDNEPEEEAAAASEPEPAGFQEPESFYEQYAHLLPNDDQQDAPAAESPTPAPAMPSPEPAPAVAAGEEDEEDIDAYMAKLMERMRGGVPGQDPVPASAKQEPAKVVEKAPDSVEPAAAPVAPPVEPVATPSEPLLSLDEIKKSVSPERSTDMASLRSLANESARHNIGVAASKQSREQSVANLVIAGIAMASGGYLLSSAPSLFSAQLFGGAFALLLSGVWVYRSLRHLLQAVRSGGGSERIQSRVEAEKLPIGK